MPQPSFLKDGFGTIGRGGWEEIYVPQAIPLTPQTLGWWTLAALLGGLLIWSALHFVRRYRANLYRRQALAELRALRVKASELESLTTLPVLLKRTALCAFPREQVASLTGSAWVAFLARTCPTVAFDEDLGRALSDLAYRGSGCVNSETAARLLDASEGWIRGHRAPV